MRKDQLEQVPEMTDRKTSRELDVEVAEKVMGLVPCTSDQHEEGAKFYMGRPCHALPDAPHKGSETPCYSTDISAAMEVEERIANLNLEREYISALIPIVSRAASEQGKVFNYFFVAHASPEQRCRAALAAVERQ